MNSEGSATVGKSNNIYDCVIVGSGPAGYTSAIYLGRAGLSVLVIAGSFTGGQLANTDIVENFPGFPDGISGLDLTDNMREQAEKFGAQILEDEVIQADLSEKIKSVYVGNGDVYKARTVVLAVGSRHKTLNVKGENQYLGRGVSYCAVCDGFFFKNKIAAVVGGGDSAVSEAVFLSKFCSEVILIHRRKQFKAEKISMDKLSKIKNIVVMTDCIVQEIIGDENKVKSIAVKNVLDNTVKNISADGIFIAIGSVPSTGFLVNSNIKNENGYLTVEGNSTRTSIDGVFAAGDASDSVYKQAVVAASMGCKAAIDVQSYLAVSSEQF